MENLRETKEYQRKCPRHKKLETVLETITTYTSGRKFIMRDYDCGHMTFRKSRKRGG